MIKVEKNYNIKDYTGDVKKILESIIVFEQYCTLKISESPTSISIHLIFGHMSMDIYFFKEEKDKEYKFIKVEYGNFVCTIHEGLNLDRTLNPPSTCRGGGILFYKEVCYYCQPNN